MKSGKEGLTIVHARRLHPPLFQPRLSLRESHPANDALLEGDAKVAHRRHHVRRGHRAVDRALGRAGGDRAAGEGDWREERDGGE